MKGVAIQADLKNHYIDHLGVFSIVMDVPFLFTDDEQYAIAKKYYPGLKARLCDYHELCFPRLNHSYNTLFLSHCMDREAIIEGCDLVEHAFSMRLVCCPHGNSDKGTGEEGAIIFANHDLALVYGDHMVDLLKETSQGRPLGKYVVTGNYRYEYYKQHQAFFDSIVQHEVLSYFGEKRKTILYAPTWNSQFFDVYPHVLDQIPNDFNVIVKLHHWTSLESPGMVQRLLGRYEGRKEILFLTDFPLVYPLLAHTDIYLGDTSSIGYDFLSFDRPLFFLNPQDPSTYQQRRFFLQKAGIKIGPAHYHQLYDIIKESLSSDQERFSKLRRDLCAYTFAKSKPQEVLRAEVYSSC